MLKLLTLEKLTRSEVIKDCLKDPCFIAKLHFFKCIASQLQPFLLKYQTDRPMTPFLSDDLCLIIRSLMRTFIKPDQQETSADKLVKIDVADHKILMSKKRVHIGFASEPSERQIKATKKEDCLNKFKKVLTLLLNYGRVEDRDCDTVTL